ncbi:MAG: nuclear transport factor 2 family protein [Jatrophihabitans sp.]
MNPSAAVSAEVLKAYLAALTAGDLDAIARSFARDATWTLHGTLPLAGTRVGRDRIMEFLVGAGGLFQPGTQRFTFGEITVQDDRAVLEWRVQGVAEATGLTYDNSYCGVFVIRNREIVEVREYLDSLHAADTLYPRPQTTLVEDPARTEQT